MIAITGDDDDGERGSKLRFKRRNGPISATSQGVEILTSDI